MTNKEMIINDIKNGAIVKACYSYSGDKRIYDIRVENADKYLYHVSANVMKSIHKSLTGETISFYGQTSRYGYKVYNYLEELK